MQNSKQRLSELAKKRVFSAAKKRIAELYDVINNGYPRTGDDVAAIEHKIYMRMWHENSLEINIAIATQLGKELGLPV